MSKPNDALSAHTWKRRCALQYKLQLSALYHLKRARFFDACDKCATAFAVVGSAAAIISVMQKIEGGEIAMSAAVTVVSTLALVFSFSQKARQHSDLARDFRRILGQLERVGEYPTVEQIDQLVSATVELESQEPSPMSALVADCQNQLAAKHGHLVVDLPFHQRLLKQFLDFRPVLPVADVK